MKVFVVFCVVALISGCSSVSVFSKDRKDESEMMLNTESQVKTWRAFEGMVEEFNSEQPLENAVNCEPRKRKNDRFAYIHCEFYSISIEDQRKLKLKYRQ